MSADKVYQLKVVLRHITPLIWRRLLVTSDTTIAQLHYILQTVMGWEDLHLHQFRIHGRTDGIDRDGGILFDDDPHRVKLCDFKLRILVGVDAISGRCAFGSSAASRFL